MTFAAVFDRWSSDREFVNFYSGILAAHAFPGYFWEHPPLTYMDVNQIYECTLLSTSAFLSVKPDRNAFKEYFNDAGGAASFTNLGGDAGLVAPVPQRQDDDFRDLAHFVRSADRDIQIEFWNLTGSEAIRRAGPRPYWLSTSGLGVYWLHARFDSRPKYYQHTVYRSPDFWMMDRGLKH